MKQSVSIKEGYMPRQIREIGFKIILFLLISAASIVFAFAGESLGGQKADVVL